MPLPHFPREAFNLGTDFISWVVPLRGLLWFADAVGISDIDSVRYWRGGYYCLPLVVAGCWALWRNRHKDFFILLILIALFSFWMSLGPQVQRIGLWPFVGEVPSDDMEKYWSTGNWFLYQLPGFSTMRATYRWAALCALALWGGAMLALANVQRKKAAAGLVVVLILLLFPSSQELSGLQDRKMSVSFDKVMITLLREHVQSDERIALIPRYNDFAVNYMASRTPFRTYNIGGDKNIDLASQAWPEALRRLPWSLQSPHFSSEVILQLFVRKEVDAVIIPFFRTVGMIWPPRDQDWHRDKNSWLDAMQPLVREGYVCLEETPYFAVVRPSPSFTPGDYAEFYAKSMQEKFSFPVVPDTQKQLEGVFLSGWYDSEGTHIWSGKAAELRLPQWAASKGLRLTFSVYGASPEHPKAVNFTVGKGRSAIHQEVLIRDQDIHEVELKTPSGEKESLIEIHIEVPEAVSPQERKESGDSRILGIALRKIEASSARNDREISVKDTQEKFSFPVVPDTQKQLEGIFLSGWYNSEGTHIWSGKAAELRLPQQAASKGLRLTFSVYGASPEHPKAVNFTVGKEGSAIHQGLVIRDQNIHEVELKTPSGEKDPFIEIHIEVPEAVSPQERKESGDSRILGIALRKIEAAI